MTSPLSPERMIPWNQSDEDDGLPALKRELDEQIIAMCPVCRGKHEWCSHCGGIGLVRVVPPKPERTWQPAPTDLASWRALLADAERCGEWVIVENGMRVVEVSLHSPWDPSGSLVLADGGDGWSLNCHRWRAVLRVPAWKAHREVGDGNTEP